MWQELSQKKLTLDQTSTPLQIDRFEVEQFYGPIGQKLINQGKNQDRLLVAVAGPPGSGKTAFAAILSAVINAALKSEQAVVIPLDGWHYPNEYLDSHSISRQGQDIALRYLKGAPETYDTGTAYSFLKRIKQGESLPYPVYSRQLHDPIPEGGRVTRNHHWVILEGNYWLLKENPWQRFQPLFDVTIFLTAEPDSLVEGLRQRHLRGGKKDDFIREHMKKVDIPNIERVLAHSIDAQIVVEKKNSQQIARVTYCEKNG